MFPFNIARSAEAVFTRWAVKRLCKFLLKKKLGKFILGDIDLDQLDVQLGQGIFQLSDLALNVDYINDKFGPELPLIIKEGSIGSLSVKFPWKDKGFHVEVGELELVLAPRLSSSSAAGDESTGFSEDFNNGVISGVGKLRNDKVEHAVKSSLPDVHEGVKTIAKIVKWFLASFHVKVKSLIVAYEPFLEQTEKNTILVLRISEAECGTGVSEDADLNSDPVDDNFLGISRLMNFVKFRGAVLELLRMDDPENQTSFPCTSGSSLGELFSKHSPPNATTPIVTGKEGGFSGNLKLSIPWNNGSLDIRRVDADVCLDPLVLRFQPSSIKWFMLSWGNFSSSARVDQSNMNYKSTPSASLNSKMASHLHPSKSFSSMVVTDKVIPVRGSFSSDLSSLTMQESANDAMLPGSQLIHDWVPYSTRENEKSCMQEEDLGASVDQFFECFDGMRNSQSALGSSGMWNWTCSVFSALTAASSLASGSLHMPSEQQHLQTNVKATFAGFSIILSLQDEGWEQWNDSNGDQSGVSSDVHFLGVQCKDIFAILQVFPQEMRFEGTLQSIEIAEYMGKEKNVSNLCAKQGSSDGNGQTLIIQCLQSEVYGALPPFSHSEDPDSEELDLLLALYFPLRSMVKMKLLSTSGVSCCQFTVLSNSSDGTLTRPISVSLQVPQFTFWVSFESIKMLLDLMKNVATSMEMRRKSDFTSANEMHRPIRSDLMRGSKDNLQVSISVPSARVMLCFPFDNGEDFVGYSSWNQFVAIDISTLSPLEKGETQGTGPVSNPSLWKRYSSSSTRSLHLNLGNLDVYLVNPTYPSHDGVEFSGILKQKFFAEKILSISNGFGYYSAISLLWQEGPVTGPWVFEKAKYLATSEESKNRKETMAKGSDFATVTAVKDLADTNSQIREEMILSSAFCVHFHLYPVTIYLSSTQYGSLHNLLDQMIKKLSNVLHDPISVGKKSSVFQASIFVECESVDIIIRPDIKEDIKSSLQSELPGSWCCLKLKIRKFGLLSASDIGGIKGASFFWLGHGEGKLWGSITGIPDREFLLIDCSNSTRKRGDGGGSNVLSSGPAGTDIIHLWDPRSLQDFTSITVRCGTIVATGGRLDWLDTIASFFSLPSPEVDIVNDDNCLKGDLSAPCRTSFVLKLVDAGLSYEPHNRNLVAVKLHPGSSSLYLNEETGEPYVACLLAASSFVLSNISTENSVENDYKIILQDIGLLLCMAHENIGGSYSTEYLNEMGYVKVAREVLLEAILRTGCKNEFLWQLQCIKSHIYLETCHDTTSALMRLAAQLQQIFAPDLEQSAVHLQSRWNEFNEVQEKNKLNGGSTSNHDFTQSTSELHTSVLDTHNKIRMVGLMDEICEDAFHLDGNQACQVASCESHDNVVIDDCLLVHNGSIGIETPANFINDVSVDGLVPMIGLESSQTSFVQNGSFSEFIEGYCLPELRPLAGLSLAMQPLSDALKCESKSYGEGDHGRGNSGWYGDTSLSIVEDHISERRGESNVHLKLEDKPPSIDFGGSDDFGKAIGLVLLSNVDISWRIYAGSDWHSYARNGEPSTNNHGRDTTTCLELALSGMELRYNLFPLDGICASKLSLSVRDFYLYDNSKNAPWKLMLGYYHSKDHPRESSSKALKLDLEAVRPDPLIPLEEYRLRVACLPVLLHLHQSQLDFLISFFGAKSTSTDWSPDQQNLGHSKASATKSCTLAGHTIANEALLPFFQKFDIWPVLVRVDYSPRHVDLAALRAGKYVELINLVPWKGVELQLKHVQAVGVYGWAAVCETILAEWLEDISQNQMRKLLQGLPTIRSLVALGAGAAKLISSPVESYKKDQRVLKGMQRGTFAFLRSISLEAVALGVHLAAGAHDILLQAEYVVTSIPSPVSSPAKGKKKSNVRSNQPKDAQQGMRQAYENLSDGIGKSANALVRTPLKKYQRGASAGSALAAALQAVPGAAIAPVSACASAAHCALLGLRNSLDPEHKKESMEKYLGPTEQQ